MHLCWLQMHCMRCNLVKADTTIQTMKITISRKTLPLKQVILGFITEQIDCFKGYTEGNKFSNIL